MSVDLSPSDPSASSSDPSIKSHSSPVDDLADRLASLSQGDVEVIYSIARTAALQGRHDKALDYLNVLMLVNPADMRFLRALAVTLRRLDFLEEASGAYGLLCELDVGETSHWIERAHVELLLGNRIFACELLRSLLADEGMTGSPQTGWRERAQSLLDLALKGEPADG